MASANNPLLQWLSNRHVAEAPAIDELPLVTFSLFADGTFCYLSARFVKVSGYPTSTYLNKSWRDLIHPSDVDQLAAYLEQPNGRPPCKARLLTRSGKALWCEFSIHKVPNSSLSVGTFADINDRIKDEAALQTSHRSLTTLIHGLPGMVYRCRNDRDWTMEYISAGGQRLTGYPVSDLINNTVRSYDSLIVPEDHNRVWAEVQSAVRAERNFDISYRITALDGQQKWVWERGAGIRSEDGELLGLEGFITEISQAEFHLQAQDRGMLYDVETSLANNALFVDRVERALVRTIPVAMFIVHFARLGDIFGDSSELQQALQQLSSRLLKKADALDSVTLMQSARFAVLVEMPSQISAREYEQALHARAEQLLSVSIEPLLVSGSEHYLSCSIGVSGNDDACNSYSDLLQNAIVALNHARASGERSYTVYTVDTPEHFGPRKN